MSPESRFLAQTPLHQTTPRNANPTQNAHRCGQPGQQHGRRTPSLSSEHTLSTCCRLVSSFLTEMAQQIHSLRASGVMSSQAASAFASDASAFRRSAGRLCTTPPETRMDVIELSRRLKDQASDTRVQLKMPVVSRTSRQLYLSKPRLPLRNSIGSYRRADCESGPPWAFGFNPQLVRIYG